MDLPDQMGSERHWLNLSLDLTREFFVAPLVDIADFFPLGSLLQGKDLPFTFALVLLWSTTGGLLDCLRVFLGGGGDGGGGLTTYNLRGKPEKILFSKLEPWANHITGSILSTTNMHLHSFPCSHQHICAQFNYFLNSIK